MIKAKPLILLITFLLVCMPFKSLAYSGSGMEDVLELVLFLLGAWLLAGLIVLFTLPFKRSKGLMIFGYIFAGSVALFGTIIESLLGGYGDGEISKIVIVIAAVYALLVYVLANYVNTGNKDPEAQTIVQDGEVPAAKSKANSIVLIMGVYVLYLFYSLFTFFAEVDRYGLSAMSFSVFFMLLLTVLPVVATLLFAQRKTWGWTLLLFYFIWTIGSHVIGIIMFLLPLNQHFYGDTSYYFQQFFIFALFSVLIYLMQKQEVLSEFNIAHSQKKKAMLISSLIAITILIGARFLSF